MFGRGRRRHGGAPLDRAAEPSDLKHLEEFAGSRRGVEAYLEPRTIATETTVMLVALDGEWTRRRVDGPTAAASLAKKLRIPLYEVAAVGYPQRKRDYDARRRAAGS